MKSIDERIVQMQFDNKQFESGVKTSLNTVDNLKKSLNFDESSKSLSNLSKAGRTFSLAGMATGIDAIASRFTTLGIMGVTAIQNITNSAINAGKRITAALTIDPIKAGFQEYETKMGAIQTILTNTASKGTTLNDVTKTLDELNTYADKTIYNFAEMTRNIGTFTAAGVDLKTSAMAIKGIANLAAGSGSTSTQASTAMYQLSQALAAGRVTLQDWNSVVNAGMGGELFQKALEKTAKELGHGRDMALSFRESLDAKNGNGWLTKDVLLKTLQKFANDPALLKAATEVKTLTQLIDTMKESVGSGWAQSWENIIGDKNQSAKLWTSVNDTFSGLIGPATDARNAMLKFWNENGGRDAIIKAISNAFQGLMSILKPIHEAFREVFPAMTGKRLVEISKSILELSKNFKIGKDTAEKIKTTFKGLFSLFSLIGKAISLVVNSFMSLLGITSPLGGGFLAMTSSLGAFITSLDKSAEKTQFFAKALEKVKGFLKSIPSLFSGFDGVLSSVYGFFGKIGELLKSFGQSIGKWLGNINFDNVFKVLNGGLFAAILLGIKKLIGSFDDIVSGGSGVFDGVKEILDGVKDSLKAYQTQLKAGALLKIAGAIGILTASIFVLSTIDPEKLKVSLAAIGVMFAELVASMKAFDKYVGGVKLKTLLSLSVGLTSMSIAILLLSVALKNIAELDWDQLLRGLVGLGVTIGMLVAAVKVLSSNSGPIMKGSGSLILFATSLLILSSAVEKMGSLNLETIGKGLLGLGVILSGFVLFMNTLDAGGMILKSAASMLIISVALDGIVRAVRNLGNLDVNTILKGLFALDAILILLGGFVILTGDSTKVISTAVGLTILSVALNILAKAIEKMGGMKPEVLAKGLATMAGALTILGIAVAFLKSNMGGAAALLLVSGALAILAGVIERLGKMPTESIVKGLLTLVGLFAILGGAAILLGPLTPILLGLAGAMTLVGVACIAIGAGLLLVGAGFSAVAVGITAFAAAFVMAMTSISAAIPIVLKNINEGVLQVANIISVGGVAIVKAITTLILAICAAVKLVTPVVLETVTFVLESIVTTVVNFVTKMVEGGMKLILGLIQGISDNVPKIVEAAVNLILKFIEGITLMIPRVVDAGFKMIIAFINGLANTIRNNTPLLVSAIRNLIDAVVKAAVQVLTGSIGGFIQAGKDVISGFISGIKNGIGSVTKAAAEVGRKALQSAKAALDSNSPSKEFEKLGLYSNQGFAIGLNKYVGIVKTSAANMGTTAVSALSGAIGGIADVLSNDIDINPTIRPVLDLTDVKAGLDSTFGSTQGISVSGSRDRSASISNLNNSKFITPEPSNETSNVTENNYNITIENPKPEKSSDSVRKTLLKYSYGVI